MKYKVLFTITYTKTVILPMINLFYYYGAIVAIPFSTQWITFFCPTLCLTIIITAIKPYIVIIIELMFRRCKVNKRINRFPMATRDL
jgi:hypothetical protein